MKDGIELWILCTATRIWRMVGHTGRRRKLRSPDGTLAARIHRRIGRTVVGVGELLRVGERTSTRMGPGEWTDDRILVNASSGRIVPHQICA